MTIAGRPAGAATSGSRTITTTIMPLSQVLRLPLPPPAIPLIFHEIYFVFLSSDLSPYGEEGVPLHC